MNVLYWLHAIDCDGSESGHRVVRSSCLVGISASKPLVVE